MSSEENNVIFFFPPPLLKSKLGCHDYLQVKKQAINETMHMKKER